MSYHDRASKVMRQSIDSDAAMDLLFEADREISELRQILCATQTETDAEIANLKADNTSTQALADVAMEHAASMRGFLLDLRSDLRERSERDGWLFKHFYDRINDQLGMAP